VQRVRDEVKEECVKVGCHRLTGGAPRQVSEVCEEIHYSVRLGGYMDRTWLQRICCAYSDILSLYFRGRDELRFGGGGRDED